MIKICSVCEEERSYDRICNEFLYCDECDVEQCYHCMVENDGNVFCKPCAILNGIGDEIND